MHRALDDSGLHADVRNTFLEFSSDDALDHQDPLEPRRVRTQSDITDYKMPVKVELSSCAGLYEISRHRRASSDDNVFPPKAPNNALIGSVTANGRTKPTSPQPMPAEKPLLPTVLEEPELGGLGVSISSKRPEAYPSIAHMQPTPPAATSPYNNLFNRGVVPPWWNNVPGFSDPPPQSPSFPPGVLSGKSFPKQASSQNAPYGMIVSQVPKVACSSPKGPNYLQLADHLQDSTSVQKITNEPDAIREQPLVNTGELTTIMLRNIPTCYSRDMLLALLESHGFRGQYNFVYLPMDFRNDINLGYAFVNALANQDALHMIDRLHGFVNWIAESNAACEVTWAHPNQGLQEHVERYRNSPVMHPSTPDEYKPMVFNNGMRAPFPAPTKAIKPPKLKAPKGGQKTVGHEGSKQTQCMPTLVSLSA